MLSDEQLWEIWHSNQCTSDDLTILRAVANAAAQAERHRIYAALEADPGALWRDQGFQDWRRNRGAGALK